MKFNSVNLEKLDQIAKVIAGQIESGVIELIGDVGAGKTTFTKILGKYLGVSEEVQSPSFTISRVYDLSDGRVLVHYDFYRLADAGVMADELYDAIHDTRTITVVEWADIVDGVLPDDRVIIKITSTSEDLRDIEVLGLSEEVWL